MKTNKEIADTIRKTALRLNEEVDLAQSVGLFVTISICAGGQKIVATPGSNVSVEVDSIKEINHL